MDGDKSYSEAMDDWARKNSFFGNRGNRLIHPDPKLPAVLRLLGYAVRAVAVLFVVWVLAMFCLRKYIGGASFAEKVGEEIAAVVEAESFTVKPLQWKDSRMAFKAFAAEGGEDAFFRELEAEYFRFDSSPVAFLGSDWDVGDVQIDDLRMRLKSGGSVVAADAAGDDAGGVEVGWNLRDSRIGVESVAVADAALDWGLSPLTHGSLTGAPLLLTLGEGGWSLDITGGEWNQNWLRDVRVEKLRIEPDGGALVLRDGIVRFPAGGSGGVTGRVILGDLPKIDVTIAVEDVALGDFIAQRFGGYVDGRVTGTLRLTGSINTRSGIEVAADLRVAGGKLRNIAVFNAISLLTESTRIRDLPIDSGTLQFRTGQGRLEVTAFDLLSTGTARITGSFTMTPVVPEAASGDPLSPAAIADVDFTAVPYHCDGVMRIGLPPESLAKTGDYGAKYFGEEVDGFRWMEVVLQGTPKEITRVVHDQMVNDYRAMRDAR